MISIDELLPPQTPNIITPEKKTRKPYKQQVNHRNSIEQTIKTVSASSIDNILENEKQKNMKDTWNKLALRHLSFKKTFIKLLL